MNNNVMYKEIITDNILSYEEFTNRMKKSLEEYYGNNEKVLLSKVKKNNGIELVGITVKSDESNISPTIYLEAGYENYEKHGDFSAVFSQILRMIEDGKVKASFDVNQYQKYELAKKRIVPKLINKSKNEALLKEIPYIEYLDLAIVFYYMVQEDFLNNATILVYNSHLNMWNVTVEEVYKDALENSKMLLKPVMSNMRDVMHDIIIDSIKDKMTYEERQEEARKNNQSVEDWMENIALEMSCMLGGTKDESPMYVLTNEKRLFGAGCLLYEEYLEQFASKLGTNLYVLPSSIHEIILVPECDSLTPEKFKIMVEEINETQVKAEEVLSNSVYYYNKNELMLSIAM